MAFCSSQLLSRNVTSLLTKVRSNRSAGIRTLFPGDFPCDSFAKKWSLSFAMLSADTRRYGSETWPLAKSRTGCFALSPPLQSCLFAKGKARVLLLAWSAFQLVFMPQSRLTLRCLFANRSTSCIGPSGSVFHLLDVRGSKTVIPCCKEEFGRKAKSLSLYLHCRHSARGSESMLLQCLYRSNGVMRTVI